VKPWQTNADNSVLYFKHDMT